MNLSIGGQQHTQSKHAVICVCVTFYTHAENLLRIRIQNGNVVLAL